MLNIEELIEVKLIKEFSIIRETLTRIGLGNAEHKVLAPSCYLLHKKGHYYLTHFKELMQLDGKSAELTDLDISVKNYIAQKLEELKYVEYIKKPTGLISNGNNIIFIRYSDKKDWTINSKYNIGKKK